jgi:hypothetical protein
VWPARRTPWLAGLTLHSLTSWLHDDTLQEVIERNPKLKIGGGQTPWPATMWLGRLGWSCNEKKIILSELFDSLLIFLDLSRVVYSCLLNLRHAQDF